MPERITCRACGGLFAISSEQAGLECSCPHCGMKFTAPGFPASMSYEPPQPRITSTSTVRTRRTEGSGVAGVLTCIFTGLMCLMMFAWEVRYQSLRIEMDKAQKELQKTMNELGKMR